MIALMWSRTESCTWLRSYSLTNSAYMLCRLTQKQQATLPNANDAVKWQWVHTTQSAKLQSKAAGAGLMTSAVEMLDGVMGDGKEIAAELLWSTKCLLSGGRPYDYELRL